MRQQVRVNTPTSLLLSTTYIPIAAQSRAFTYAFYSYPPASPAHVLPIPIHCSPPPARVAPDAAIIAMKMQTMNTECAKLEAQLAEVRNRLATPLPAPLPRGICLLAGLHRLFP